MALNNSDVELKQQQSKLVVRVDQDSDSDLQALFDSVLKPDSKRPLQIPLRMRKLPNSFFNPPSTGSKSPSISHSRENSADSAFGSPAMGGGAGGSVQTGAASTTVQIAHARAHSSPASLQQTYAVSQAQGAAAVVAAQAAAAAAHHVKQRSYDVATGVHQTPDDLGPLPAGWEQARTSEGQIYYLNHTTRSTTWEDPRKTLAKFVQTSSVQHQSAEQLLGSHTSLDTQPPTQPTTQAIHLQRTPAAGAMLPQAWLSVNTALQSQDQNSLQACQQKLRLQSLKLEREMLKQRQQEIRRQQELMLRQTSSDLPMDPFLSGLADHSRQASADSGLGMGTTYPMPHTPEDFLGNIDDNMDVTSEGGVGSTIDTSELTTLNDNIDNTDDLVPSLHLGEEFSSDILDDVQSLINPNTTKADNVLTWL